MSFESYLQTYHPYVNLLFSINLSTLILSTIDCCVLICSLTFFINSTGSLANANYLGSLFWLAMILADLPMGYIADHFGPKRVFLVSIILRALGFILFFMSEYHLSYLLWGNFIAGIAFAFMNNAFLMQTGLLESKYSYKIDNRSLLLNNLIFKSLGFLLGCILSYLVIQYLLIKHIWIASFILSIILFFTTMILWDSIKGTAKPSPLRHLKLGIHWIQNCAILKKAIITNALLTLVSCSFLNNWVVIFVPNLEHTPNTLIMAFMVFYIIRIFFATAWKKLKFTNNLKLTTLFFLFWLSLLMFSIEITFIQGFAFISTLFTLSGIELQLRKSILENLGNNQSGIVLSIHSLCENLAGTIGLLMMGYFLKYISMTSFWSLCSILLIFLSITKKMRIFIKQVYS